MMQVLRYKCAWGQPSAMNIATLSSKKFKSPNGGQMEGTYYEETTNKKGIQSC